MTDELKLEDVIYTDEELDKIEEDLRCPITHELMADPVRVVGEDERQVFERAALEEWIRRNGGQYSGPQTRKLISQPRIVDARDMREQIEIYKALKQNVSGVVDETQRQRVIQTAANDPHRMGVKEKAETAIAWALVVSAVSGFAVYYIGKRRGWWKKSGEEGNDEED